MCVSETFSDILQQVVGDNSRVKISLKKNKQVSFNALAFTTIPRFKGEMWALDRDRPFH